MNRKKLSRIISALLLLVLAASLLPAQAYGEATVREILSGFGELTPVKDTPYLLAKEVKGKKYGLFNTDGEQLIPYAYEDLFYLAYNCFGAVNEISNNKYPTLEEINSNAIVTADGTQVTDYLYGAFEVFSTYWACGWVLGHSTAEDYDLKSGDDAYYCIKRCDIYYLGDHAIRGEKGTEALPPPLSLSREEYKSAKAHGKYLYVQDREDQIKIYDSQLNPVNAKVKSMDDSMYLLKNYSVVIRGSTDILFDGYTSVKEVRTVIGLLLNVTRVDYSGNEWSTVLTPEGEQLMPFVRGKIDSLNSTYAVMNIGGKVGLYSLKEQKLLVPCEFDKIITNTASLDRYSQRGYVCVQKDGKTYYYAVADGTLYESAKPGKKWKKSGSLYVLKDGKNSRYRILPPDRKVAYVDDVKLVKGKNYGTGYLLSFSSENYQHMLVTWRGEIVLKFRVNPFTITYDDKAVIQNKNGTYSLLEVITGE